MLWSWLCCAVLRLRCVVLCVVVWYCVVLCCVVFGVVLRFFLFECVCIVVVLPSVVMCSVVIC